MEWKEIVTYGVLILAPTAWIASSAVSAYHEYNRHKEQNLLLTALRENIHANSKTLDDALLTVATQKVLLFIEKDDGSAFEVRSLSVADQKVIDQIFKRIAADRETEAAQ